jgi:photosystem II stability/assembly factor-like uncharacterized protein
MNFTDRIGRRGAMACLWLTAALAGAGCHSSEKPVWAPLATQKIYVSDRFFDIEVLSPKRALVVGYAGKLLETEDGGVTWNIVETPTDMALYSIEFADEKTGWIVGQESVILKTTDGGKTWKSQGGNIWMGDDCRDTNGEDDDDCALAPLFAVTAIDANHAVAIGDRSTVARTEDGGTTWTSYTLTPEGLDELDENQLLAFEDPVLYDVQFFDENTGFVVGEFGKLFKTTDGGKSWVGKQASLVGDEYFFEFDLPTFFDVQFLNREVGYAVGLEGRIAKTTDGGETWAWQHHGVEDYDAPMYSASVLPNGTVWVVGSSGQVVTAPGGGEFQRGSFGTQVNNWIREVEFFDDNHGWVVGGFGFIMSTEDGGKTWFRRIG